MQINTSQQNADLPPALPGELLMWVLIVSEIMVFGAGLIAFMSVRLTDPIGFADAQSYLNRTSATLNTGILVTSGYLAARALLWRHAGERAYARFSLLGSAGLGVVFIVIKATEFADKTAKGITWETHPFFTFYYLLTGFHTAHVAAGIVLLLVVTWQDTPRNIEAGAQFWHMVDLVWILLFPIIYLVR